VADDVVMTSHLSC